MQSSYDSKKKESDSMDKVGMVVNYYWPSPSKKGHQLVTLTTQLALLMLKQNPVVGSVVLVDASPQSDSVMRAMCLDLDLNYLHDGRELSLAEGYNLGWHFLAEPYVGLMANDILPHSPKTMELLLEWIKRPDVGCVFPYLSDSDYLPQQVRFIYKFNATCEPAGMTLNLNIFKRSVLEDVGGVDEGYIVGFYDPILVIKIRQIGFRVVQVGHTRAIHLNRLTKNQGGSALTDERWETDREKFAREYAGYCSKYGIWGMSFWRWPFSTSPVASVLWWLIHHGPRSKLKQLLEIFTMWIEPLLTRYPAKYGMEKPLVRHLVRKDNIEH